VTGFIAVSAANVYWTQSNSAALGTVMMVPVDGGMPLTLATGQDAPTPIAITVDGTSVYWTDASGLIETVPLTGGAVTTLVGGPESAGYGQGIATGSSTVYWTAVGPSVEGVMQVPIGGGPVMTLVSSPTPYAVAADTTSVYWTNNYGTIPGTVMRLPLDGGAPVTLASGQDPRAIAVDATSVYWTDHHMNAVMKVARGGGAATTLASGQASPAGIAVDATSVYWTDSAGGSVMKLTPK
jgi:hypothetical protein